MRVKIADDTSEQLEIFKSSIIRKTVVENNQMLASLLNLTKSLVYVRHMIKTAYQCAKNGPKIKLKSCVTQLDKLGSTLLNNCRKVFDKLTQVNESKQCHNVTHCVWEETCALFVLQIGELAVDLPNS